MTHLTIEETIQNLEIQLKDIEWSVRYHEDKLKEYKEKYEALNYVIEKEKLNT